MLGPDMLLELLGGRRTAKSKKRTTVMPPGVPGSSASSRRPENRKPGAQRWQALDSSLHRTRRDAMRADAAHLGRLGIQREAALQAARESGPELVRVPPKSGFITTTDGLPYGVVHEAA